MIRLTSALQARSLKGTIPDIAIIRMVQFEGDDGLYDPERHGFLTVIESGDVLERDIPDCSFKEWRDSLDDDDCPSPFDYVRCVIENGQRIYEAVIQIDDERTIAIFIPESVPIDSRLKLLLENEAEFETF